MLSKSKKGKNKLSDLGREKKELETEFRKVKAEREKEKEIKICQKTRNATWNHRKGWGKKGQT